MKRYKGNEIEEHEKLIFDVRLKEIQSRDKNYNVMILKLLAGWLALVVLFFQLGFFTNGSSLQLPLIVSMIFTLLQISLVNLNLDRYLVDCYDWLCYSIKNGIY